MSTRIAQGDGLIMGLGDDLPGQRIHDDGADRGLSGRCGGGRQLKGPPHHPLVMVWIDRHDTHRSANAEGGAPLAVPKRLRMDRFMMIEKAHADH